MWQLNIYNNQVKSSKSIYHRFILIILGPFGGAERGRASLAHTYSMLQFLFKSSADKIAMISAQVSLSIDRFANLTAMIGAKGMFLLAGCERK